MTDDESDVDAMDILTRREVLSGGSIALLSAMGLAGTASAQTGTEPRIQLGSDWEIDDYDDGSGNNNLRIRHQPSGAELVYNVAEQQWEIGSVSADNLDIAGNDFISGGNLATRVFENVGPNESTTSSSYGNYAISQFQLELVWDDVFPGSQQSQAWFTANVDGSNDQIDFRLYNATDAETILEVTGTGTVAQISSGPTTYTPSTTGSPIDVRLQFRNADNASTVNVFRASMLFGVGV